MQRQDSKEVQPEKVPREDGTAKESLLTEVFEEERLKESKELGAKVKSGLSQFLHKVFPHHPILKNVITKHKNDPPEEVKPLLDDLLIAKAQLTELKNQIEAKKIVEVDKMLYDQKMWTSAVMCIAGWLTCLTNPCFGGILVGTGGGAAGVTKLQQTHSEYVEAVNDLKMINETIPKLEAVLAAHTPSARPSTTPAAMWSQKQGSDSKSTPTVVPVATLAQVRR